MDEIELDARYEVEGKLGAGGFGTTYAALDRQTGVRVAVKVLDLRRVDDWKAVELFEREAKVLRSLDHPGIPAYVEFRPLEADRAAYLVQTLAPGDNLEKLIGERRFTEEQLIELTRGVLAILDYLTRLHPVVVHRDIKPANILLDEDGAVSLVDFGAVQDVATATMSGGSTVAGTFGYMAPEQLQGVAMPSSDLYGLGMTLVHLASGRSPTDFDKKRLKPDFRPHVHLSDAFERVIDRLIEPVPDDRFQTAAEVVAALDELGEDEAEPGFSAGVNAMVREARERAEKEIAAKARARERALAKRRKEDLSIPKSESPHSRATFTDHGDSAELAVVPARGWRGREMHFAALAVIGPVVSAMTGAMWGAWGTIGALLAAVGLGVYFWLAAPVWRLRVTDQGDFILYARGPESPMWAGRLEQLSVATTGTAKGGCIGWLYFDMPGEGRVGQHFYPMGPGDKRAFEAVRQWMRLRPPSSRRER